MSKGKNWSIVIEPKSKWFDFKFREIWRYRDLLVLFVRRDFVSVYKQTVLGPIWFFVQPVLTSLMLIVLGRIAKIPTDGIPAILFYLAGTVTWSYFSECLTKTSATFTKNSNVFGKVYFPRMVVPLSVVVSNLMKYGVKMILFLAVWAFYMISGDVTPNYMAMLLWPALIVIMAGMGLGFGIIFSSLTTKYRDFQFLVGFGVALLMYATPVIYPLSMLEGKYRMLIQLNPMTSIIETFKYAFLGKGVFDPIYLLYSFTFMVVILFVGMMMFNKVEKSFMDTV